MNTHSRTRLLLLSSAAALLLGACNSQTPTGKACIGSNQDTLVEGLGNACQKGDIIATKNPALFCDFNYAVTFNDVNSAFCVYIGGQRGLRSPDGE